MGRGPYQRGGDYVSFGEDIGYDVVLQLFGIFAHAGSLLQQLLSLLPLSPAIFALVLKAQRAEFFSFTLQIFQLLVIIMIDNLGIYGFAQVCIGHPRRVAQTHH